MKTKSYFMLAALALSAAACSNSENEYTGPVEARITAGLAGAQTRAVDANWNKDNIGVKVTSSPNSTMSSMYCNVKYSTSSTGTTAEFTAATEGIFFQNATEIVTFAAYAPYQTSPANDLPGTDNNGHIPVNTAGNNTSGTQESIDFLYASGATASRSNPTVQFTGEHAFAHKMARLDLVLKVSTTDGFTANQIFDGANVVTLGGLKHEGEFDVTSGSVAEPSSSVKADWEITSCKYTDDQTNYTRTYSLILLPQTLTGALPLTINIDGQNYKNANSITPALEAGNVYTYTITVKKTGLVVSGCTITNWNNGGSEAGVATMQ
ncbi:MAG: fimbrillin family protein [Bacteroidaceae bacterium]